MIYHVEFARTGTETRPALFIEAPTPQTVIAYLRAARFRQGWACRMKAADVDATPDLRLNAQGRASNQTRNLDLLFAYMGGKRP